MNKNHNKNAMEMRMNATPENTEKSIDQTTAEKERARGNEREDEVKQMLRWATNRLDEMNGIYIEANAEENTWK